MVPPRLCVVPPQALAWPRWCFVGELTTATGLASEMENLMEIEMALPAVGEAAAPAADGGDDEPRLVAWNEEVGQARFRKMFLGGHGEPVASGDVPMAKVATNGLIVDVVAIIWPSLKARGHQLCGPARALALPRILLTATVARVHTLTTCAHVAGTRLVLAASRPGQAQGVARGRGPRGAEQPQQP